MSEARTRTPQGGAGRTEVPYLYASSARNPYRCDGCGADIRRGERYFRDEPHPWGRRYRGQQARHLCAVCVLGEEDAAEYVRAGRFAHYDEGQLELVFEPAPGKVCCVPARVHVLNITPQPIQELERDPDLLPRLSDATFEELVFNRFEQMGLVVRRIGAGTYQRDGGIDALAWPRSHFPFPFILALQAKHVRLPTRRIGPEPVRDLLGVVAAHGFNAGFLVTNTSFTPDAKWFAAQRPALLQLRDIEDLRRWLRNEFLREYEWRRMPRTIEVCKGIIVELSP